MRQFYHFLKLMQKRKLVRFAEVGCLSLKCHENWLEPVNNVVTRLKKLCKEETMDDIVNSKLSALGDVTAYLWNGKIKIIK